MSSFSLIVINFIFAYINDQFIAKLNSIASTVQW